MTLQDSVRSLPRPLSDAQALMLYQANKKSLVIAYLLWCLLGLVGGHRFYFKQNRPAVAQLLLLIFGFLTLPVGAGFVVFAGLGIWVLVDAFLIPGWAREANSALAMQLGRAAT